MRKLIFTAMIVAGGVSQASAVTIDFDDDYPTYFGLETYQEEGYTLTSNVPEGTLIDVNNVVRGNLGVFSGGTDSQSLFWGANGALSTITLTNDSATPFYLLSLDASSLSNLTGQLLLNGTKVGGGSVSQVLNLDGNLTTYGITGMDGLASLDISFDGSAAFAPYDLDNIQLTSVPVPAAVWLFASALGMLGWLRRSVKH
jgi:hypothetical protein